MLHNCVLRSVRPHPGPGPGLIIASDRGPMSNNNASGALATRDTALTAPFADRVHGEVRPRMRETRATARLLRGPADRAQFLPPQALIGGADARLKMMARSVDFITSLIPVTFASFYRVGGERARLADGPIVCYHRHRGGIDPEALRREYSLRYWALDPFDPASHDNCPTILGADEVGGRERFARTQWASEYLPAWGLADQVVMFMRANGRVTAAISLGRRAGAPEFGDQDRALLRRCHPFIEDAYALAQGSEARPTNDDVFYTAGLTAREKDIARHATRGATNEEIAQALMISCDTVKTHLKHVFVKLKVRSRTELAALLPPYDARTGEATCEPARVRHIRSV
jgi:DNA-binding CsgD family transcriptional regulator